MILIWPNQNMVLYTFSLYFQLLGFSTMHIPEATLAEKNIKARIQLKLLLETSTSRTTPKPNL